MINLGGHGVQNKKKNERIKNVMSTDQIKYETRRFKITVIHSDNEFNIKANKDFLQPTILQIYPKDEHV